MEAEGRGGVGCGPGRTGVDDGAGGSVVGDAVVAGEREALGEGTTDDLGRDDRSAGSGRDDPAVGLDRDRKSGVVLAEEVGQELAVTREGAVERAARREPGEGEIDVSAVNGPARRDDPAIRLDGDVLGRVDAANLLFS